MESKIVILVTKKGTIIRTSLKDISGAENEPVQAFYIAEGDEVVSMIVVDE